MAELDGRQSLVNQYVAELHDLTFNSKPLINTLTMIASENPQASSGIAEAIERRIASVRCLPHAFIKDLREKEEAPRQDMKRHKGPPGIIL